MTAADDDAVRSLYASLRTPDLVAMREAFTLDLKAADLLATRVFCHQRIAMLGELLRERMREAAREQRKERAAAREVRGDGRASGDALDAPKETP